MGVGLVPERFMARIYAKINLKTLALNVEKVKNTLPSGFQLISVLKANAYGHGAKEVAQAILDHVDIFAVANVGEARELREQGLEKKILLLSPVLANEEEELIAYNLMPTISSLDELVRYESLSQRMKSVLEVHLKIDTGMGRLGVDPSSARSLYDAIRVSRYTRLGGVYTHFPSADTDYEFTQKQRLLFFEILRSIDRLPEGTLVHCDNSAGLGSFDSSIDINAIRIGLSPYGCILKEEEGLYGGLELEPVLSLCSRVGLIKDLPKGWSVSYGQSFNLKKDSRIAVVTAGYADGLQLGLSNQGCVLIGGKRFPIIGRVTMDLTIVDISLHPDDIAVGDEVVFIGSEGGERITLSEYAQTGGSIEWEALTSLNNNRISRIYL